MLKDIILKIAKKIITSKRIPDVDSIINICLSDASMLRQLITLDIMNKINDQLIIKKQDKVLIEFLQKEFRERITNDKDIQSGIAVLLGLTKK